MNWTSDQLQAITEEGQNIIVSAGAGSGKTAVLTERVIRKLKNNVNINNLLVLTFTEAAASEMKERIRKAIKKNEELKEQLDYIDSAYITTFDSYALSIVKKYHYLLNVSKNIQIVDSSIINIAKKEALETIFEELYKTKDEHFLKLINDFCDKDDAPIKKAILKLNNALEMKIDKEEYLDNYIKNFYNETHIENLFKEYEQLIQNKINTIKDLVYNLSINDNNYYEKLIKEISPLLESKTYEDIKKNIPSRLPILRNADEITKYYKEELNTELKNLKSLTHDTKENHINNIKSTKDYIIAIINIIKKLDKIINEYKYKNDTYEFIDISKMAINVVKDNPSIKEELKNYYNEIMVDEYQDTNDLQEMFISLLDNHNVYMVGDVKQSIYRFRNANPDIFKNKYDNYGTNNGGKKIDLVKNFRSRKEVLNGINEIFDLIMDQSLGGADYKESHQMVYGNLSYINEGKTTLNNDIELLNYELEDKIYSKEEIEIFTIANDINKKIKEKYQVYDFGTPKTRDITYSDFCIIMDRNTAFDKYKKIFEYLNIPLNLYKDEVLTSKDDIFLIKNILNLIIKINENELDKEFKYYYTSIARSYLFEQSDDEILNTFVNNSFKETKIFKIAKEISDNLNNISNLELLNEVINKFNLYQNSIKVGNIKESMVRLEYLQNLALNLENLGYTPIMFTNYIKEMIESEDEIKYSVNTSASNSVKIMNIHKSKGLEFPICYFSGLYKTFNIDDLKNRFIFDKKYGIITPYYKEAIGELITKTLYKENYLKEEVSEKIRLFYVALTRCKEKAILVGDFNKNEIELNENTKLKYRSFQDMINSVKNQLLDYIKDINIEELNLTKKYNLVKKVNYEDKIEKTNEIIINKKIELNNEVITKTKFSKTTNKLITNEEKNNMEYGTKVHELFELETNDETRKRMSSHEELKDIKDAKIYKEYEFIYEEDNKEYHGIIDLLLEYQDYIKIIDYKLKNIEDDNYIKQLNGYKNYIEKKTNKKVTTYLYSILENKIKKI